MSLEMNRRKFAAGTAGLLAAYGFGRAAVAQDASPEATAEDAGIVTSVVEGPGEDEVTVIHAQGETIVKKNPSSIVCFDFASIETIEYLGGSLAGVPEITGGPELASDAEIVGSLFEPDFEAVNAMAPDLIIVAGRSAAVYPDLSNIAPTIDLSFGDGMVEYFAANTTVLGAILEADDETAAAIEEVEGRVADLQGVATEIGTGIVIMVSGGAVSALAPGNARAGRGSLIYEVIGVQPPIEDLETATHGEPISFEFLLEHNPDWLFVIDRDQATGAEEGQPAAEVLDNEIMHETAAYQNDQIIYLNPFDWYIITGASVPSFNRMLDEMETAFTA